MKRINGGSIQERLLKFFFFQVQSHASFHYKLHHVNFLWVTWSRLDLFLFRSKIRKINRDNAMTTRNLFKPSLLVTCYMLNTVSATSEMVRPGSGCGLFYLDGICYTKHYSLQLLALGGNYTLHIKIYWYNYTSICIQKLILQLSK